MKIFKCGVYALLAMLFAFSGCAFAQEESHPSGNSEQFDTSKQETLKSLENEHFMDFLASPSFGAVASDDYAKALNTIKSTWSTLSTSAGDPNIVYDVILQAGHYQRVKGLLGTSGKDVTEQQLVAYLVRKIQQELTKSGQMNVLTLSADKYSHGLKAKIFLAIHADGSTVQCKTGPSLSYQTDSSTLAMHAIGWGLTQAVGYKYGEFKKDGFTANAANYYMFSQVNAPLMKGILEVGELTCPEIEERLVVAADGIAINVARAIKFVIDSSQTSKKVTLR